MVKVTVLFCAVSLASITVHHCGELNRLEIWNCPINVEYVGVAWMLSHPTALSHPIFFPNHVLPTLVLFESKIFGFWVFFLEVDNPVFDLFVNQTQGLVLEA
ncbi:hypothetical protein OUZ56_011768 [Daphnia magna]|uniref:Secreted protein n=1 Tax=Daphnia magna TaxID=35525 RepID=A0ABQ9Z190_9CRUS|nr:hypothetical protein OUZ56_011768 [Daphnia magna]